jgi:hypothetical protein
MVGEFTTTNFVVVNISSALAFYIQCLIADLRFFVLLFVGFTGGLFSFQRLFVFSLFNTKRRVLFNGEELFAVINEGASVILGGALVLGTEDSLTVISVTTLLSLASVRVEAVVVRIFASLSVGIVVLFNRREGFRIGLILGTAFLKILGELRIVVSLKTHIIFSAIHISE